MRFVRLERKGRIGRMAQNQWSTETTNYTYDTADHLLAADGDSFTYDKSGNLLSQTQFGLTRASYSTGRCCRNKEV